MEKAFLFRLIQYKTVGEDLTESLDLGFGRPSAMFFVDRAMAIQVESLQDPAEFNESEQQRTSNWVKFKHLPSPATFSPVTEYQDEGNALGRQSTRSTYSFPSPGILSL